MKKIKALTLKKTGILKKFLYKNKEVKTGDKIALITNENNEFIITAPFNGVIVNQVKIKSKIKKNDTIACLLTTENEIKKYYLKNFKKINFNTLNKEKSKILSIKNNKSKNKWKKIKDDFYSKIDNTNKDILKSTSISFSKNEKKINNNNNNNNNINLENILIKKKSFNNKSIFLQNFIQNNEKKNIFKTTPVNNISNIYINPIKNRIINFEKQKNNIFQDTQIFKNSIEKKYKTNKNLNIIKLSFNSTNVKSKKIKSLSFKNLKINYNYNINNQKKIFPIKTSEDQIYKKIKKENNEKIINIDNLNINTIQENNFVPQTNNLNKSSTFFSNNTNNSINEILVNQKKPEKEKEKEKEIKKLNKHLINNTEEQSKSLTNTTKFLNIQEKNNNFRNIVNERRKQLHHNNDYHKLSLENNNLKNSTDFLDEYGNPKILRNIIQKRMNDLIKKNMSPKIQNINNNYIHNYNDNIKIFKTNNKESSDKDQIFTKENIIKSNKIEKEKKIYSSSLKTYHDRLYEKLNNNLQREKILKTKNQRELIKKRLEQISKGENIDTNSDLNKIDNYDIPLLKEEKKQHDEIINNNFNNKKIDEKKIDEKKIDEKKIDEKKIDEKKINEKKINNKLTKKYSLNKKQLLFKKLNNNKNMEILNNIIKKISINQKTINNNIMIELAILKERLFNQEQNSRYNKLLHEIKNLHNNNNNNNNYKENINKIIQKIFIKEIQKIINNPNNIIKKILKKYKIDNVKQIKQNNENIQHSCFWHILKNIL